MGAATTQSPSPETIQTAAFRTYDPKLEPAAAKVLAGERLDANDGMALYASTDAVLDASDTLLTTITGRRIKIGAHKSISIRVVFQSPDDLLGGTFDLISSISSTTTPSDTNTSNNTAAVGTNPA